MKRQHISNRSGIARRPGLIALGCALPIAVTVLFMVRGIDGTMRFAQMEHYGNAYRRVLESLSFLALLSAFVLTWWNARSMLGPVGGLNGNGRDEISQEAPGFGRMIEGAAMMKEDNQSGVQRTGAAADMSADMEQQAGASIEQSSTVMEVTMAVEDLARTATRISSAAQPLVHSVVATLAGMHAISDKMDAMAKRLVLLGEKSQAIGKVTGLIDDLTDQANLLALNGAIEAARAGEAGRAFAVVAAEFRALAERSSESTQDIRNLIIEIQTDTNASILEAQEAAMAATEGLERVTQMTKVIQEVSLATLQQKSAADQVVLAIHKVDETAMQF